MSTTTSKLDEWKELALKNAGKQCTAKNIKNVSITGRMVGYWTHGPIVEIRPDEKRIFEKDLTEPFPYEHKRTGQETRYFVVADPKASLHTAIDTTIVFVDAVPMTAPAVPTTPPVQQPVYAAKKNYCHSVCIDGFCHMAYMGWTKDNEIQSRV